MTALVYPVSMREAMRSLVSTLYATVHRTMCTVCKKKKKSTSDSRRRNVEKKQLGFTRMYAFLVAALAISVRSTQQAKGKQEGSDEGHARGRGSGDQIQKMSSRLVILKHRMFNWEVSLNPGNTRVFNDRLFCCASFYTSNCLFF